MAQNRHSRGSPVSVYAPYSNPTSTNHHSNGTSSSTGEDYSSYMFERPRSSCRGREIPQLLVLARSGIWQCRYEQLKVDPKGSEPVRDKSGNTYVDFGLAKIEQQLKQKKFSRYYKYRLLEEEKFLAQAQVSQAPHPPISNTATSRSSNFSLVNPLQRHSNYQTPTSALFGPVKRRGHIPHLVKVKNKVPTFKGKGPNGPWNWWYSYLFADLQERDHVLWPGFATVQMMSVMQKPYLVRKT